MLRQILLVLGKELRSTVRDPHVLAYLLFPVVMYPGIILGTVGLMHYRDGRIEAESWRIQIEAPADVRSAVLDGNTAVDGGIEALARGDLDVVVSVTQDGDALEVALDQISTRSRSRAAATQVHKRVQQVHEERVATLLERHGIAAEDAGRVLVTRKVKDPRQLTRFVAAALLCAVVPLAMLIAGVYPTVELIVSERERGTLETTLVAPVSRFSILAGKIGACVVLMLAAGLGNAGALALTANQLVFLLSDSVAALWIPPLSAVLALPTLIGCALLFAGSNLLSVLPARSFKEGEHAATLGMTAMTLPIFGGLYAIIGPEPAAFWMWVPVANAVVAVYLALQVKISLAWVVIPAVVNGGVGLVLLTLAARVLGREDTLFGDGLPGWLSWIRRLLPE